MNKYLKELTNPDAYYHVGVGLLHVAATMGLAYTFGIVGVPIYFFVAMASLYLYQREVGQVQSKLYDNNFFKGWGLDLHHHAEWVIPSVILLALAWIV